MNEINRLLAEKASLTDAYNEFKKKKLKLDLSRGKPDQEQLKLSMPMLDALTSEADYIAEGGIDIRNYGCLDGLIEAKRLMAEVMETSPEWVIIFCDSSLNIMYDLISKSMTHGVMGSTPWCKLPEVKFLCPVPGYDRHFAITEYFGIKMINVPLLADGPDMDMVEELVAHDDSIKGIWCVPKYANPTGTVYSDETCIRIANLKPAAKDFRVYWDNAYCVHHLDMKHPCIIPDILRLTIDIGNPNLVYKFASFSKISFSGSAISALACSPANMEDVKSQMRVQTIGHNKINQMRHVRFFKNRAGVLQHMEKHAAILKPKFDLVQEILNRDLAPYGIASWTDPRGGYFVSFNTLPGLAKKVVAMMKEAGVTMTEAGATYPYHLDPEDSNIRIAPTYASLEDLRQALEIFTVVVKLCTIEKIENENQTKGN